MISQLIKMRNFIMFSFVWYVLSFNFFQIKGETKIFILFNTIIINKLNESQNYGWGTKITI